MTDALRSFVLGTVQIGMTYGATNAHGAPADGAALVSAAARLGIGMLDTAQAYGTSEQVLGGLLKPAGAPSFEVISKIAPSVDCTNADDVLAAARESVSRIGKPLYGLMYHDPAAIHHWMSGAAEGLTRARDEGLCGRIGVSIYTPEEMALAASHQDIDILQAPFNMLDRRLEQTGAADAAIERGCEVHFRSLFLQGLLLGEPGTLPERLAFARPWVAAVREACRRHDADPAETAIGYVRRRFPEARLVIGCDDAEQLAANAALFTAPLPGDALMAELAALDQPPEQVVNPALWPREAA